MEDADATAVGVLLARGAFPDAGTVEEARSLLWMGDAEHLAGYMMLKMFAKAGAGHPGDGPPRDAVEGGVGGVGGRGARILRGRAAEAEPTRRPSI